MVFYDPRKGISQDDWKGPENEKKFEAYASEFRDFNSAKSPKVFVARSEDIEGCKEIGLPTPTLFKTTEDALEALGRASSVLSGRVHNAIPAVAAGIPTTLVAVDSRYLTLESFRNGWNPITDYLGILP